MRYISENILWLKIVEVDRRTTLQTAVLCNIQEAAFLNIGMFNADVFIQFKFF